MKKTIATTNSSVEQLERDINSLKSTPSSSQASLKQLPAVSTELAAIAGAEPDTSDVPTRSQQNFSDILRLEHNYCSFESTPARQEDAPTEAVSMPPCLEMVATSPSSPLMSNLVEVTTSDEPTISQEDEYSVCVVEEVSVTEVPQVLVYDIAADQVDEPEVDISPSSSRHTISLLPKKTFKKRAEPPAPQPSPKKDRPGSRRRRQRKRRASATQGRTPSAKRRPRDIQLLQRQGSLPASMDMESPLGSALSRAINTALCPALSSIVSPDGYSSLTRSFQLPEVVAQSQPAHSSASSLPNTPSSSAAANSVTHSLQNGFSSDNRVPEILTDLVTSLNTETLTSPPHSTSTTHVAHASQRDRGGDSGVNDGGSDNRVTGILSNLVTSLNTETMVQVGITSPPPVSSEQRFPSDRGGVSGIVNNLVTYLTSETINASFSADSANSATAVSAVSRTEEGMDMMEEMAMQQHAMEVEICASPFSLPTDSEEVNTLTSGCEASEEYESDEEERVSRRREKIDADSLFHPGSDILFTLGPKEPPLFILPRVADAGDFPLEIDPAAVSSVALDVARQCLIHAPHSSSDVSSDITESELTELSEFSDRATGCGDNVTGADEEGVQSEMSTAESKTTVISSESRESEERDRTPTLEELSQSNTSEVHAQNLLTQQVLLSDDTIPKGGGRSAENKKGKEKSQQEKGKHSSSVPSKSVAPASRAKPASSAKTQKSSKTGKKPPSAATASKATASSGSKVKEGEGVSVGGAKEQSLSGSGKDVQMQLKMHMARLEELKGHLASKKSAPQTTTATEISTSSSKVTVESNSQPSTGKSAKSVASPKSDTKLLTAKPSQKTAKTKQSTAKSVTVKTASPKKASTISKSGASSVSKPATASAKTEKVAVPGTSKVGKSVDEDEGMTCARTMGYVRKTKTAAPLKGGKGKMAAKSSTSSAASKVAGASGAAKKGGKLTMEAAMSEIGKIVKARRAKLGGGGTSASSNDVQTVSDNLHKLWQSNQKVLLEKVPHPLPAVSSTSGSFLPSHRCTTSLSPSAISEKFVTGIEKLDKPKKQMTSSLHHSGGTVSLLMHRRTTYHPYSSPLLMFQSYRLNPLYRTNEKLPLHSLSHSNKIDPNRIMCRFELGGICNDPSCAGQHFKDIALDKEELIQDLVCYAPQLAGCGVPETESEGLAPEQPLVQLAETKGKIVSYASQMVERYKKKVSNEDLFKLTVHDVNKERAKLRTDPRAKASYISFDDREWLATQKDDDLSFVSVSHPLSVLASEPRGGELATFEGEGERGGEREEGESEMEWNSISKELMPLGKQRDLPRYMDMCMYTCVYTIVI
jgi:hypothetical protein